MTGPSAEQPTEGCGCERVSARQRRQPLDALKRASVHTRVEKNRRTSKQLALFFLASPGGERRGASPFDIPLQHLSQQSLTGRIYQLERKNAWRNIRRTRTS